MANVQGKPAPNLPVQFTSFIGRVQEVAEVRRELARSRLVTVTGPGGIGKTRLALHAAEEEAGAYGDGVWFVDLAAVQDEALVPDAVARALAVRERPTEPLMATLQSAIGERCLLLILDNCEHLVARCADLADTLLRACPELSFLATSREALGVVAERVWRVPALQVPDTSAGATAEQVAQNEAAALFVQRAARFTALRPLDRRPAASPRDAHCLHMCRGNKRSAWIAEGNYDAVAEKTFSQLGVDRLLLEYDDVERTGGFEVLRFVPLETVVVLGLVSTKVPALEHVDALRPRTDEASIIIRLSIWRPARSAVWPRRHLGTS